MYTRIALNLTLLCLIGSLAALFAGVGRPEDRPPLRFDVDPFVVDLDADGLDGRNFDVYVVNNSDESVRIVGSEEFCGTACFAGCGLPATIPANGRGLIILRVRPNRPGPFTDDVVFFTDCPGQPRLTMRVVGNIREDLKIDATTSTAHP